MANMFEAASFVEVVGDRDPWYFKRDLGRAAGFLTISQLVESGVVVSELPFERLLEKAKTLLEESRCGVDTSSNGVWEGVSDALHEYLDQGVSL